MKRLLGLTLILACICGSAYADGGRLRFSKTAGPFLVTLFTTPEPLTPGPADFSVMVQENTTGQVLSDARVQIRWTSANGTIIQADALNGTAVNKLLSAAEVGLPSPGIWNLQVTIQEGSRVAVCEDSINVVQGSRISGLIWTFALLPVIAIGLFILNQRQKAMVRTHPSLSV